MKIYHILRRLSTPRVLLYMSLLHKMVIEIFFEIAYIRQLGYISSCGLSGLRHLSCELEIPSSNSPKTFVSSYWNNFLKSYFYQNVICCLHFGHSYLLYVTSLLIIKLFLFDLRNFIQVWWTTLKLIWTNKFMHVAFLLS